jgi:hypothetical protein
MVPTPEVEAKIVEAIMDYLLTGVEQKYQDMDFVQLLELSREYCENSN